MGPLPHPSHMNQPLHFARSAACAVLLLACLLGVEAEAQQSPEPLVVARATVRSHADLERLVALGLDLLEMRDGDDLFILTTPTEVDRLRVAGFTVRVDLDHTSRLERQQRDQQQRGLAPQAPQAPQAQLYLGGYRTVSDMRALLEEKAAQYPDLAEVFVYGESWERVTGGPSTGHDLFGIKLGNRQRAGPKPTFFLMAAIHARELSTSELALRFVDHLLSSYGVEGDATWLLDEHLIVVVPVANPDGRVLAEQGYLQRKNTDTTYGACSVPNIGVDLNRNSLFKWGTVNTPAQSACSATYPGPVAVSEPETQALQTLIRSFYADQRGPSDTEPAPSSTTGILITLHSYGELVMWPWGWTSTPAPNSAELTALGRKLAAYNGYTPQQSIKLYPTSGTTDDWAYGELGIAAFTFEIGPGSGECGGFFPPFSCLDGGVDGAFWPRNLPAFLYAARTARAPYELGQGPTAEAATTVLRADGLVDLDVLLDEQTNGGRPIAAAEYYLDTPPWRGGTAVAMVAADGGFDSAVEVASAVLGPFTERHLVFVRGQDTGGAWGVVHGVFTPDPGCPAGLSSTGQSFANSGGSGTVPITVPDGCAWTAATVAPWITITGAASGVGAGSVSYEVAANTGASARTGVIAIDGQRFTVSEAGLPDLRATQVGPPPATAAPGSGFSASDTTENVGGGNAPPSTTRFYLSLDGSKDSADKLLVGSRAVPALVAGGSSAGLTSLTIPSSTTIGNYVLLACADDTAVVVEATEANNCVASSSTVQVTRPDLIEIAVSDPPGLAEPGARFAVTDTVKNQGLVGSAASTTRYYLSTDPAKGTGDKLLTGTRSVPALAAGVGSTSTINVTIPNTMKLGLYYLLACADDTAVVAEVNETNNCRASASRVQVTRPDLVETTVSDPPAVAVPGSSFAVTDIVKNAGLVVSAPSTTRYYLSADRQRTTGDRRLTGSRSVPLLADGASHAGTVSVTIPSTTPPGQYYLLACADDRTLVAETDERNNCVASATPVMLGP